MIKTAQDAYLAGRQAGMEKVSRDKGLLDIQSYLLANQLIGPAALGTIAGTGLGTYMGDRDLRSAGISALGALGGGQVGGNLGVGLGAALHASGIRGKLPLGAAVYLPTIAGQLGGGYLAGQEFKRK